MGAKHQVKRGLLVGAIIFAAASHASASTTYTDATGDEAGTPQAPETDINNVVVSNDGTNLTFAINLGSSSSPANLSTYPYVYYEIGIQTSAGGSTNTTQNPYYNSIGISTGMTDFIAAQLSPDQGYVYEWEPSSSSFSIGLDPNTTATPVTVTNDDQSVTVTVPLSYLGTADASGTPSGIATGTSFNFDVWTTYSGGTSNSAYDALDNPNTTPGYVGSSGASYDAATAAGSTFASTTYTVTAVPEPASLALSGGLLGIALVRRRRR